MKTHFLIYPLLLIVLLAILAYFHEYNRMWQKAATPAGLPGGMAKSITSTPDR